MKYKSNLENPNGAHYKVVSRIPRGADVLELGCAQGYMTHYLGAERNCRVWAVEIDPQAAEQARPHAQQVIVADLDRAPWPEQLDRSSFDVIVLADVLEHLQYPAQTLRICAGLLAPEGRIVLSLPNISHQLVIAMLLRGDFVYGEIGLLDSTHVRFFTPSSFARLAAETGFSVEEEDFVIAPVPKGESTAHFETVLAEHPHFFDSIPHASIYQFIVVLRPLQSSLIRDAS